MLFFSPTRGRSTCTRCRICKLQHYWYVARTISYILISCTAKRRSCFFALCIFWNEAFYTNKWGSRGAETTVCCVCRGRTCSEVLLLLHFNLSLLFWLSSPLCFFPKPLESQQESQDNTLAEQDCTVPCLGWQAGSRYLSFSTSL